MIDLQSKITLSVCASHEEAPNYHGGDYKSVVIETVCIVNNGTIGGKPTIDFIFMDETGQKYNAIITAKLLGIITDITRELEIKT